jgi:predicted RNase H-like HicB family nuclease
MERREYTIILHPDTEEGGFTVTVPALPGCVTQGETLEEAIAMAKEAIRLHVEGLVADGESEQSRGGSSFGCFVFGPGAPPTQSPRPMFHILPVK